MNGKKKLILCVIAVMVFISGCSAAAPRNSSFLEFFGFQSDAAPSAPTQDHKVQNAPQSEDNPFGVEAAPNSGGSLNGENWGEIDPALIEPDSAESETKSQSSVQDDWDNDDFMWSFSENTYADVPLDGTDSQAKIVQPGPGRQPENPPAPGPSRPTQAYPQRPSPHPGRPTPGVRVTPTPTATPTATPRVPIPPQRPPYNPVPNYPVFRPIYRLPCTGFPTGMSTEIRESIQYTPTSMSLTIPSLNLTEDIVVVPLVDNEYPVESLGGKIGLLEGSGPGSEDIFVLVGHNHLNTQEKGPFVELSAMKVSDLIFIRGAKDASRTFVVYANEKFAEEDIEGLLSYVKPGCMILITCEDESINGGYLNRRVIFAEAKEN